MHKLAGPVSLAIACTGLAQAKPEGSAMTNPASGLQVWLGVESAGPGQRLLKPYLKSAQALKLRVSVRLTQKSAAGNSQVSQQANLRALPDQESLLTQVKLGLAAQDECYMDITVNDQLTSQKLGHYRLNCQVP